MTPILPTIINKDISEGLGVTTQVRKLVSRIGVWEIIDKSPQRVLSEGVDLEGMLEDWITNDPSLIQAGLVIIGRQANVDSGRARLDLLALDPQGRWVVIEIKRGMLSREAIAQVIDYTACLASMIETELEQVIDPQRLGHEKNLRDLLKERDALESLDPENRDVAMIIVGTGRAPELDKMASFLSGKYGFPLSIVTFHTFTSQQGTKMLVRELNEPIDDWKIPRSGSTPSVDEVQQLAEQNGIGTKFKVLREAAEETGLYAHSWKTSVMYAPQNNKTRCLYTAWVYPVDNKIRVYLSAGAFTEFFDIPEQKVSEVLGSDGWLFLDEDGVARFASGLRQLLKTEAESVLNSY